MPRPAADPVRRRIGPAAVAHSVAVAVVAGLAATPGGLSAQAPLDGVPTVSYTHRSQASPIAGRAGDASATLSIQGASGPLGLRALRWEHDGSGPCRVVVEGGTSSDEWGACEGAGESSAVRVDSGHLVGLRVCTGTGPDTDGSIRGLRATWAVRPDRAGPGRGETSREATGPDCRRWSDEARCAPGTAAPRLRLHIAEIAGRPSVEGLQLLCHDVDLQCWEMGPGPDEVMTAVPADRCAVADGAVVRRHDG